MKCGGGGAEAGFAGPPACLVRKSKLFRTRHAGDFGAKRQNSAPPFEQVQWGRSPANFCWPGCGRGRDAGQAAPALGGAEPSVRPPAAYGRASRPRQAAN